jgi:hypothetical protein
MNNNYTFDACQHATLIAALRYWQWRGQGTPENRADRFHDLATNSGTQPSLADDEIDDLVEHLQFGPEAAVDKLTPDLSPEGATLQKLVAWAEQFVDDDWIAREDVPEIKEAVALLATLGHPVSDRRSAENGTPCAACGFALTAGYAGPLCQECAEQPVGLMTFTPKEF